MTAESLSSWKQRTDSTLRDILASTGIPSPKLRAAMEHALFPGGKRMRPILVFLCSELLGVPTGCADILAASVELMHTYSLVHDDLPAMDNDDLRRGLPTCHRAFDEATAILAGDALQSLALEVLLTRLPEHLDPEQVIVITNTLAQASGPSGMVSGQSLDLDLLADPDIPESALMDIHTLKTGRLIQACAEMVSLAAQAADADRQSLGAFAGRLGISFQIRDDYLDLHDAKSLGKAGSSDRANAKTTFASLYSREALSQLASAHFRQTLQSLAHFGEKAEPLRHLVYTLQRDCAPQEDAACNFLKTSHG